jgi:hypothetical protein
LPNSIYGHSDHSQPPGKDIFFLQIFFSFITFAAGLACSVEIYNKKWKKKGNTHAISMSLVYIMQ